MNKDLIFLKLGGSLITDKTRPRTVRPDVLKRLCAEIASARKRDPNLLLLLGHGSGSFGHVAAKKYGTRNGVFGDKSRYWHGFAEVGHEAATLNKIVMDSLRDKNISAMAISPSASVVAEAGKVATWDLNPLKFALTRGIVPVVYGDVVFDAILGGTILSTEDLFMHLAWELHPRRVLLVGLEDGIYADFPARKHKAERVTPQSFTKLGARIGASEGTDVTGGMASKLRQMLDLVTESHDLSVQIFSGKNPGNLERVLLGEHIGTLVEYEQNS